MLPCPVSISARQPRRKVPVSAARISRDLISKRVPNVPSSDGRIGVWRFSASERRKIKILEQSRYSNVAQIMIYVETGNDNERLRGRLKVGYEQTESGFWQFTYVENVDTKVTPSSLSAATSKK